MNPILPAMTVLALLVGISGCLFVRDRWDPRDDRQEDRYAQGYPDHSGRDC